MRKASREVREFADIIEIIDKCQVIHLAMISQGEPYVVPLSFGYDADMEEERLVLYFHGAREGRKIDALRADPHAAFSMSSGLTYPGGGPACTVPSYYRSVCGRGRVSFVEDPAEKAHALRSIFKHVTGISNVKFAEGGVEATCVYRLDVTELTGKQNLPREGSKAAPSDAQPSGHPGIHAAAPSGAQPSGHPGIHAAASSDSRTPAQTVSLPPVVSAYVDGSYDSSTGRFSYGCVILDRDKVLTTLSEAFADPELAAMHNVAGEIKGAEAAMRCCLEAGVKELTIYHDYEGIAKWPLGLWKANKQGTIAYRDYYNSLRDKMKITFVKVKGHSGVTYNEMADRLAGEALR